MKVWRGTAALRRALREIRADAYWPEMRDPWYEIWVTSETGEIITFKVNEDLQALVEEIKDDIKGNNPPFVRLRVMRASPDRGITQIWDREYGKKYPMSQLPEDLDLVIVYDEERKQEALKDQNNRKHNDGDYPYEYAETMDELLRLTK